MLKNKRSHPIMENGIVILLVVSIIAACANGQCPVAGCSPNHCYCSEQLASHQSVPKQLWYKKSNFKLSTQGCVANGENIVCPLDSEVANSIDKGCLVVKLDGRSTWECNSLKYMPLPLVDTSGKVIASDGHYMQAYDGSGKPLAKPIYLFPEQGGLFDIVFTDYFFIMIYKCGFVVANDYNGITWASIWLNETFNSVTGTFVPLGTPAVFGKRLYLPTAFWPHHDYSTFNQKNSSSFTLRLFALDVTTNQVDRIRTAWTMTKEVSGYLPTLKENFEDCKFVMPPLTSSSDIVMKPVAHIITVGDGGVILGLNYNDVPNGYDKHLMIRLNDTSSSYKEIFYDSSSYEVHVSLSNTLYLESTKPKANNINTTFNTNVFDKYLIAGRLNMTDSNNTLLHIDIMNAVSAQMFASINLEELLTPLTNIEFTTFILTMILKPDSLSHSQQYLYLIFGVRGINGNIRESHLVGVQVDASGHSEKLWIMSPPDECEPVGLLSTNVNKEGKLILIVSTQCGIVTYHDI